jgi:hypothetical protein
MSYVSVYYAKGGFMLFKFRVWDENKKQFHNDGKIAILPNGQLMDIEAKEIVNPDFYKVMLFTGIQDRDNKDIYEGDFVFVDGIPYFIKWMGMGEWFVDEEGDAFVFSPELYEIKIFGNVYQNSESK